MFREGSLIVNSFSKNAKPIEIEIPFISTCYFLDRAAQDYPDQAAIIEGGKEITYLELKRLIDCFATSLWELGIREKKRVVIVLPNCTEHIIAYYAILKLGGIVIPINPQLQAMDIQFVLEESAAYAIIGEHDLKEKLELIPFAGELIKIYNHSGRKGEREWNFEDLLIAQEKKAPTINVNPLEDIATLRYIEDSSGEVKVVMLTHHNLVSNVYQIAAILDGVVKHAKERIILHTPFSNCMPILSMAIFFAATLIPIQSQNKEKTQSNLVTNGVSLIAGESEFYLALLEILDKEKIELNQVKLCFSETDKVPYPLLKEFERETGANIIELFGLSKLSQFTHFNLLSNKRKRVGNIGIPLPGTKSEIVDLKTGINVLPPDEVGGLIVCGPQIIKGYWNLPEETSYVLRSGWYHTGEMAAKDKDGYFYSL